jgi:DNA-binding Lrp family transcriptional regulator
MTDAYVNVLADPGAVSQVAEEIHNIDEVSDLHVVTGDYDIIAQLDLDDPNDLPGVVAEDIHDVTGVIETTTNVAYEP